MKFEILITDKNSRYTGQYVCIEGFDELDAIDQAKEEFGEGFDESSIRLYKPTVIGYSQIGTCVVELYSNGAEKTILEAPNETAAAEMIKKLNKRLVRKDT